MDTSQTEEATSGPWSHGHQNFVVHKIPIKPHRTELPPLECAFLIDERMVSLLPANPVSLPPPSRRPFRIATTGDKGAGMFAVEDIPEGGLILVDHPAVVTPGTLHGQGSLAYAALCAQLRPDIRTGFLEMCNSIPSEECGIEEGIVRTNGTAMTLPFPSSMKCKPAETEYGAVFLILDRCNHSCGPNAAHKWDVASLSSSLYALRPIRAGEEICIIYTDATWSRASRRAHLYQNYRFMCCCQFCDQPNQESVARSDDARRMLKEWIHTKPSFLKWSTDLCREDDVVICSHQRALELIEQEGMQGMQIIFVEEIALSYAMLGDEVEFRTWARRVVDLTRVQDPGQAEDFGRWLNDPKSYSRWAWRKKQRIQMKAGRRARNSVSPSSSPLFSLLEL